MKKHENVFNWVKLKKDISSSDGVDVYGSNIEPEKKSRNKNAIKQNKFFPIYWIEGIFSRFRSQYPST